MESKKEVIFFPGKDTPLKRYVSFFPSLKLKLASEQDNPKLILCHSRGLENAIKYCAMRGINPIIIAMDGVQIEKSFELKVINFRPERKRNLGDENMYMKIIYYKSDTHYSYMEKNIRNLIVNQVNNCVDI